MGKNQTSAQAGQALLEVAGVEVVYDGSILGVADISLTVGHGEAVALLGANGAGKSTTLKAISGIFQADRAEVTKGSIRFKGEEIVGVPPNLLAERGVVHVLEGRHVFSHLTVEENLRAGAFLRRPGRRQLETELERIYAWFPRLKAKRKTEAGLTSGGEQQMLAIGRALLTKPELVLLDEPSMGLAPIIVEEIFDIVARLNAEDGVAFLIAEQNAAASLRRARRGYILDSGRAVLNAVAADLLARGDLQHFYLGVNKTPAAPGGARGNPPFQPEQ